MTDHCAEAVQTLAAAHPLLHMWWVDGSGNRHDIGRPGDNLYRLSFLAARPHKLLIEFDDQVLVVLTEPELTAVSGVPLRLDFEQMTLDWQGYGDLTPHASTLGRGYLMLSSH